MLGLVVIVPSRIPRGLMIGMSARIKKSVRFQLFRAMIPSDRVYACSINFPHPNFNIDFVPLHLQFLTLNKLNEPIPALTGESTTSPLYLAIFMAGVTRVQTAATRPTSCRPFKYRHKCSHQKIQSTLFYSELHRTLSHGGQKASTLRPVQCPQNAASNTGLSASAMLLFFAMPT